MFGVRPSDDDSRYLNPLVLYNRSSSFGRFKKKESEKLTGIFIKFIHLLLLHEKRTKSAKKRRDFFIKDEAKKRNIQE